MVDAVIEFMTTFHEGGRRGAYGWVYVLLAVFLIGGALSARELAERRKRLLTDAELGLVRESLTAAVLIEQDSGSRFLNGRIQFLNGSYELTLWESIDDKVSESKHAFSTIDQLGQFLESNSVLRLSDFKDK